MATTSRNFYDVLGVPPDADDKTIKNAFRELALQYHPDRNKAPDAEEKFKEIAAAYAVLSDPQKRATYDAGGAMGTGGFSPEDLFSHLNMDDLFGGFGFGGGSIFDRFFHRRAPGPPRGANLEVDVTIPLARVLTGGEETVHVTRLASCATCQGSGAAPGTQPRSCESCQGTGRQTTTRRDSGVMFQQITTCTACQGRGSIIEQPCAECHGAGEVPRDETLTVTIPVGVEEGTALRIPGHGLPSRAPGGTPGDLFVVVHSAPDPHFERHGADLWHTETLEIPDVVLGTELAVPTLEDPITVKVQAGTQPGTVLCLHGKGLPVFRGSGRGELYVRVQVHVPEHLSREARKLYERLRALKQ